MKEILSYAIKNQTLSKLTLSKCQDATILRTTGRLVLLKGKLFLALESFLADGKAIHQNIPAEQAVDALLELVPRQYKQMNIHTTGGDCEIKVSKKGKVTVIDRIRRDNAQTAPLEHNREKQYIIPADKPVDFLVELGVQDANGRIFDKKRSKFRQINRFLEMVADIEHNIANAEELYILDLCCGKSYLSFAVYYYFTQIRGRRVVMDCVDLKQDVIAYCTEVAEKLHYSGLHFVAGDIRHFPIRRTPDLTVSLHACDIATDIVLAKGIASGSKVILSTPCCHHEMMHQLKPQGCATDLLLEHSILKQKFADAATDALRCKILQINGYDVNALELIDPEETPKNVLIRAVKMKNPNPQKIQQYKREYEQLCQMLGIHPYLQDGYAK